MGSDNGREGIGLGDGADISSEVARPKTELEAKINPVLDSFAEITPMQKATILAICGRLNRDRKDLNLDILARSLRYLGPIAFIADNTDEEPRSESTETPEVVGEIAETFRGITEKLRRTGTTKIPVEGGDLGKKTTGIQAAPDTRTVAERMDAIVAGRNGIRKTSQTFRAPTSAELAEARRAMEKEKDEEVPKTEAKPGSLLASIKQTLGGVADALDPDREK